MKYNIVIWNMQGASEDEDGFTFSGLIYIV